MQELGTATVPDVASVKVRDGTEIAVAVYSPSGRGPFPALFAPSPYRFDNNVLPASPQFLWRETGPIDFYVEQGYAYVHMDVRGSGRSGGEFDFFGRLDQRDLYDVIEWIGGQPWSNGRVGGIGQSYYCNPGGEVVTRGWLRASHRALDPARSTEFEPYHTHAAPEPIVPGEVYRFDISLEPMAFRFRQGSPDQARDRQRRFAGDRGAVDALLPPGQDRPRHDPSRCPPSLGADPAGDERIVRKATSYGSGLQARQQGERVAAVDRLALGVRHRRVPQLLDADRGFHEGVIGSVEDVARRRHHPQGCHRGRRGGARGIVIELAQFRYRER